MSWTQVATADELKPGDRKSVFIDDEPVLLVRVDDAYYAIDDVCTHDEGSLDQGVLEDFDIECPRHGARFDVRTGEVTALPASLPIDTFEVRVQGDDIQIDV